MEHSPLEESWAPAVGHRRVGRDEARRAHRSWWDGQAAGYHAEHGAFLGGRDLVWGPEGLREADAGLLGPLTGRRVLEVGCGAAQGAAWCADRGAEVLALDLSLGMLREARHHPPTPPLLQADARCLPLPDAAVDVVFTAYGALPFLPDAATVLAEWARVTRPGGRVVASVSHPVRWAFPDDPGPRGLTADRPYFDRTPYVEESEAPGRAGYVEFHRTVGDWVRALVTAGLDVLDLVEPEWTAPPEHVWGGWSGLRGALLPGTLILVAQRSDPA